VADLEPEEMVERIASAVSRITHDGKIIVTIGGEHTVSVGPVKALLEKHAGLSVLQMDAHADLRESYQGSRYSHACAMRRIRELAGTTAGVGIRNVSSEEAELVDRENIPLFYASDITDHESWHEAVLDCLSDRVYLTIDLDGFDPSVVPGVGTPEPGGLGWYQALRFLRKLCRAKEVVGFDVVELMPIPGSLVSEFTAARLIYKLIGYIE
jgi:agmatinase